MRTCILYLLLMATLLPTVSSWGIIAQYQLDKDYLARILCENRDRPELHCDGKCYLAKRLKAQQDKQDKETTERVQKTPSIQLFWTDATDFSCLPAYLIHRERTAFVYQLTAYSAPLSPIFQPPTINC